jgi:hypothetical protein
VKLLEDIIYLKEKREQERSGSRRKDFGKKVNSYKYECMIAVTLELMISLILMR